MESDRSIQLSLNMFHLRYVVVVTAADSSGTYPGQETLLQTLLLFTRLTYYISYLFDSSTFCENSAK